MQDRLNRDKKIDSMVSASLVVLSIQNGTFITPALMFYLIARQSYIENDDEIFQNRRKTSNRQPVLRN